MLALNFVLQSVFCSPFKVFNNTYILFHFNKLGLSIYSNNKVIDIDKSETILFKLENKYLKLLNKFDLFQTLKMYIICNHYVDTYNL